jgi:bile acid-coenzyme A ligase
MTEAAHVPLGVLLQERARRQPSAKQLSCGTETRTVIEFHRRTNRLARGLLAMGVNSSDLVTIGLPNGIDFIEIAWACWKMGATPMPLSFRMPKDEVAAITALAEPTLIVAQPDFAAPGRLADPGSIHDQSDDEGDFDYAISPVLKAMTSGGSTGRPKLILSCAKGMAPAAPAPDDFWRILPGETAVVPGPLYHNGPFELAMRVIVNGGHLVILPRFDPEATLAAIDRHKASWINPVPTMMHRIWRLPAEVKARYDVSSLKTLWHGAAPCAPWLKQAYIDWLGPDVVREVYGSTEGTTLTAIDGNEWITHQGSVGRPVFGQIMIADDQGIPLPLGDTGEICLRPDPGTPPTYRYVGAEPRKLVDGWETMGDMGWVDEDGYLYLADRRSDMVLIGGANVYPAEIEGVIEEFPEVGSCAVIGLPDDDMGSRLHAILQAPENIDLDALQGYLRERLTSYKWPRSFEIVDEPLRDAAGKVRRTRLRDERIAFMGGASAGAR